MGIESACEVALYSLFCEDGRGGSTAFVHVECDAYFSMGVDGKPMRMTVEGVDGTFRQGTFLPEDGNLPEAESRISRKWSISMSFRCH